MSKKSRRAKREAVKEDTKQRKRTQKELREKQRAEGLVARPRTVIANRKCNYETKEEEQQARQEAVTEQVRIFRNQLPTLLKRLAQIKDPRNPKKVKHKVTVLMIYGILTFVFHMASRRKANQEMTRPMFVENLELLFPELETMPHHDTLGRLLERIDVEKIEEAHVDLVRCLIRKKKFRRYLINNCYPIAVDGTQKFARDTPWSEECLERRVGKPEDGKMQYFVYTLEANLGFRNGMTIPLVTEFLNYLEGDEGNDKQDCELKAFKRLSKRLKAMFSHLPILLLLDGLYPNGPILELCRKRNWDFMIVLQDESLKSVWHEFAGIKKLGESKCLERVWHGRLQRFEWVNNIVYEYGNNLTKKQTVHVVVCEETWEDVDKKTGEIVTKKSRHAWISRRPLSPKNVHERCNLGARHRWSGIESSFNVEKHQGYQYEHCFSHNWKAMKGYHYLMRLAHLINELAKYSRCLVKFVRELGFRGLIDFIRETIVGPWLIAEQVLQRLRAPYQLRFSS